MKFLFYWAFRKLIHSQEHLKVGLGKHQMLIDMNATNAQTKSVRCNKQRALHLVYCQYEIYSLTDAVSRCEIQYSIEDFHYANHIFRR